jgi:alkaline phosphatase
MKQKHIHSAAALGFCLATAGIVQQAQAAPLVTRLNPPSALFSMGDAGGPYISRFLENQRFDLQATIQADPGKTITSAVFEIGGKVVPGTVTITPIGNDQFSATLRAFSTKTGGVNKLTIKVVQNDGLKDAADGNFEIVRLKDDKKLRKAKNIIYLIGDGMGIAHRTAARLAVGNVQMGKASTQLAMDKLPQTALVSVASLNSIVTDSAPGAACYSVGNKSNNNQEGVFPDDTNSSANPLNKWDNPRVEHMGSYLARTGGKALGIVSTADVEDATPASFAAHTADRGAGTGICDMFLDESAAYHNLRVLLGGGRKWFIPQGQPGSGRVGSTTSSGADYTLPADIVAGWGVPAGAVDPTRDLIADFEAAGFAYAPDKTTMEAADNRATKLLGLFNTGNMDVALDKLGARRGGQAVATVGNFPDQPMLEEMTSSALTVLNRNAKGFVLMVEAASIDKQAHNMDTERWIMDTIEFDKAVQVCLDFQAKNPETLIVVTADHECAGVNIIGSSLLTNQELVTRSTANGTDGTPLTRDGAGTMRNGVVGVYEAAGFPLYSQASDGYPSTMDIDKKFLVGYAANADRFEDWLTNPVPALPTTRDTGSDYFVTGQVAGSSAVHTASDVPLSAGGRGAELFRGVMDNTDVYFKVMEAVVQGVKP